MMELLCVEHLSFWVEGRKVKGLEVAGLNVGARISGEKPVPKLEYV